MKIQHSFLGVLKQKEGRDLVNKLLCQYMPNFGQSEIVLKYNQEAIRRNEIQKLLGSGDWVTGAQLARQIGITRTAINKNPIKYPFVMIAGKKRYKSQANGH